ncbi:hypothetical protein [Spiroplasma endosymbiont of Asaphidion curtum]|uniref:hypothetical protein n=1 Tax=Spiroplasma endosymbiont of Asaphidion curtum TaxID=3066281 RepID=UPI00313DFD0D
MRFFAILFTCTYKYNSALIKALVFNNPSIIAFPILPAPKNPTFILINSFNVCNNYDIKKITF